MLQNFIRTRGEKTDRRGTITTGEKNQCGGIKPFIFYIKGTHLHVASIFDALTDCKAQIPMKLNQKKDY